MEWAGKVDSQQGDCKRGVASAQQTPRRDKPTTEFSLADFPPRPRAVAERRARCRLDTLGANPNLQRGPGCGGKPTGGCRASQNRMFVPLQHIIARLRAFISSPGSRDDATFDSLALELFGFQFANNPALRRLCEVRRATPDRLACWREIPAIPTRAFKEFEVSCLPTPERSRVFHSSSTTGQQPSRHFHCDESLAVYEASLQPWFGRHLLAGGFRGRMLSLTPSAADAPHSSLAHMLHVLAGREAFVSAWFAGRVGGDGSWHLDGASTTAALVEACVEQIPVLLAGTAFSFVHLLDHLKETKTSLQLPEGSRVMETGGYKGRSRVLTKAELHRQLTDHLGMQSDFIVCEYGMSELSSQAYDQVAGCPRRQQSGARIFCFPPWARAVVISPETGSEVADGATGLLRIFDLANVCSALAIQTEDLAIRHGDGFTLLGRAEHAEPRGCSLLPAG